MSPLLECTTRPSYSTDNGFFIESLSIELSGSRSSLCLFLREENKRMNIKYIFDSNEIVQRNEKMEKLNGNKKKHER